MSSPANSDRRTTVTSALPYANGPLHIGHMAGAYLPADVYVRYLRGTGKPVLFVCGTDEHGVAITIRAMKDGQTPREIVDHYHTQIRDTFQAFDISFDIFSRTSTNTHRQLSQDFFRHFVAQEKLVVQESEQYFDPEANLFLADRYILGTCPQCQNPNAYGDQCEKCGSSLSPNELLNPRSALSGAAPVKKATRHWFYPLDRFQDDIQQYVDGHRDDWKSNVFGQCSSWLKAGLHPRAITRDLDWGVPVPTEIQGHEGKVLYVWFDAPLGYISATQDWAKAHGQDWQLWWKKEHEPRIVHFIGKDNIVFHTIIFPSMLREHGDYAWAEQVPANEFLNLEGEKMSTSRNWAVWLHEYDRDFAHFPLHTDMLRYVLTAIAPETKDSDFSWKDFQARINNELVAVVGNFVNRAMVLCHKFCEGKVPAVDEAALSESATITWKLTRALLEEQEMLYHQAIQHFRFREGLAAWVQMARIGNQYLQDCAPWQSIKTDSNLAFYTLRNCLSLTEMLAQFAAPYLPRTSAKMYALLNLTPSALSGTERLEAHPVGHVLAPASLLFTKIEDEVIEAQLAKLKPAAPAAPAEPVATAPVQPETPKTPEPAKDTIPFDTFAAVDLRVGTILSAEAVPKSNKLLKLSIDLGFEQRTILSGIAQHFRSEDLAGRRCVVVANLAPRTMMGMQSQGMLLTAAGPDGQLHWLSPAEGAPNGATVA